MILFGLDIVLLITTYLIYKDLCKTTRVVESPIIVIEQPVGVPPKYEDINENTNENSDPPSYN